jgi:hypothetical protein
MTKIENLAFEIAVLGNSDIQKLAQELVKHYPTRADALTHCVSVETREQLEEIYRELGIAEA